MQPATQWPADDELRQLLRGTLNPARQSEIENLLEQDEALRLHLEAVAGGSSWIGRATPAADDEQDADAALQAAMQQLKDQANGSTVATDSGKAALSLQFLQPSDHPESLGRLGPYEVLELLGIGGFGIVLKALDTKLHRTVAIKVLSPALAMHATARQRFMREALAAAAVPHEHLVTIHAIEEAHMPPYIVMEYVSGLSLQQLIDREGPLPVAKIVRIGAQAAAGLAAAHRKGNIHRDIKPANILLENGVQRVKITDFGLARAADDASLTQSGVVAGTPQYMAPEQARGEAVDYRSDLFSLGSVLYTMCTGRPAFRADSAVAVLKRVCEEQPRPIPEVNPDIPDWLVGIIHKLMAKSPADRFQSAQEVSELLERCLAHVQQPGLMPLPAEAARLALRAESQRPAGRYKAIAPAATAERPPLSWQRSCAAAGVIAAGVLNIVAIFVLGPAIVGMGLDMASIALLLVWLLLALVGIAGGLRFGRGEADALVYVGCVLAMLVPPGMIVGLPAAVAAFILLYHQRQATPEPTVGRDQLPDDQQAERERIERLVAPPAVGLLAAAVINGITVAVLGVLLAVSGLKSAMLASPLVGVLALASPLILAGAIYMRRLRRWPLATAAAVAAMLVIPGSIIGLFAGIWALVVLCRRDVRNAFEANERRSPFYAGPYVPPGKVPPPPPLYEARPAPQSSAPAIVMLLVIGAIAMMCLLPLGLLVVGGWFFTSLKTDEHASLPPHELFSSEPTPPSVSIFVRTSEPDWEITFAGSSRHATHTYLWNSNETLGSRFGYGLDVPPGTYTIEAHDASGNRVYHRVVEVREAGQAFDVCRQAMPAKTVMIRAKAGEPAFSNARGVALSADGSLVGLSLESGSLLIADAATGDEKFRLPLSDLRAASFSPDGKYVAAVLAAPEAAEEESPGVIVCEVATQKTRVLRPTGKHTDGRFATLGKVGPIAFSPDGKTVVAATTYAWNRDTEEESEHRSVVLRWDLATGDELPPLEMQDGTIAHLAFPATQSDILIAASNAPEVPSSTLLLWDVEKREPFGKIWERGRWIDALAISAQGGWTFIGQHMLEPRNDNVPRTCLRGYVTRNPAQPTPHRGLWNTGRPREMSSRLQALAISPDNKVLASARDLATIELFRCSPPDKLTKIGELIDADYRSDVQFTFTPDSRQLILTSGNGVVRHYDVSPWTER